MNKEEYLIAKESIKKEQSELVKKLSDLRSQYIESNKPCNIDQLIEVINNGGRKIVGQAKGFSISVNSDVYVDAIKPSSGGMVYLSKPHNSIKLL